MRVITTEEFCDLLEIMMIEPSLWQRFCNDPLWTYRGKTDYHNLAY